VNRRRCASLSAAVTLMTRCMLPPGRARWEGCGPTAGLERPGQRLRLAQARDSRHEALHERQRFGRRQGRFVLDGIGDPAQQIRVGDRNPQCSRQLRNRQREGARNVREYLVLIDCIGNAGIHEDSISENRRDSTPRGGRVWRKYPKARAGRTWGYSGADYSGGRVGCNR